MKSTHTIQDIEKLMFAYVQRIRDAKTKEEKKVLLKELRGLEKHYNQCQDKNGKKYPKKQPIKDTPKSEVLKLIDSVKTPEYGITGYVDQGLDVSGVFVK